MEDSISTPAKSGKETDITWMERALAEAHLSGDDIPVGAAVVMGGRLLSVECNRREASGDPTAHAEILAIRQAAQSLGSWRLSGAVLYTTLEPCPMCAEACIQSRISKLVFGAYDPASGACGSAFNLFVPGRIFPIPEVVGGLLEDECQSLLVHFFGSRRG